MSVAVPTTNSAGPTSVAEIGTNARMTIRDVPLLVAALRNGSKAGHAAAAAVTVPTTSANHAWYASAFAEVVNPNQISSGPSAACAANASVRKTNDGPRTSGSSSRSRSDASNIAPVNPRIVTPQTAMLFDCSSFGSTHSPHVANVIDAATRNASLMISPPSRRNRSRVMRAVAPQMKTAPTTAPNACCWMSLVAATDANTAVADAKSSQPGAVSSRILRRGRRALSAAVNSIAPIAATKTRWFPWKKGKNPAANTPTHRMIALVRYVLTVRAGVVLRPAIVDKDEDAIKLRPDCAVENGST